MDRVTCTRCKRDLKPEYHCHDCDGEYINKQELIKEIKKLPEYQTKSFLRNEIIKLIQSR